MTLVIVIKKETSPIDLIHYHHPDLQSLGSPSCSLCCGPGASTDGTGCKKHTLRCCWRERSHLESVAKSLRRDPRSALGILESSIQGEQEEALLTNNYGQTPSGGRTINSSPLPSLQSRDEGCKMKMQGNSKEGQNNECGIGQISCMTGDLKSSTYFINA